MFKFDVNDKFFKWSKELQRLYTEEIAMRYPDEKHSEVEQEIFRHMSLPLCVDGIRFLCRFVDFLPAELKSDRRRSTTNKSIGDSNV